MSGSRVIPGSEPLSAIVASLGLPGLTPRRAHLWSERNVLPPAIKPIRRRSRGRVGGTNIEWPKETRPVYQQLSWLSKFLRRQDELRLHMWFLGHEYDLRQIREDWRRTLERRQTQVINAAKIAVGNTPIDSVEDRAGALDALAYERARRMRKEKIDLWSADEKFAAALGILMRRTFAPQDPTAWTAGGEELIQRSFGRTRWKQSRRPSMSALLEAVRGARRGLLLEMQAYAKPLLTLGLSEALSEQASQLSRRGMVGFAFLAAGLLMYRQRMGAATLQRWFAGLLEEVRRQSPPSTGPLIESLLNEHRNRLLSLKRTNASEGDHATDPG